MTLSPMEPNVSDISCLWGLDIKEWVKTHLSKVSGDDAPMVNSKQDRAVQICAPRSTVHSEFRTPLAFRSLSKGGGSGIGDAALRRLRLARPDQRQ
jgi:hypothetical protein